ncbi:MAG: IS21 family transposase [Gemmatimonadota bacterium]|nr:IS21 family transposase [Gemmatimonadota bacterium]
MLLKHLLEEGLSKQAIADRLGVSRRVVYHWLATGQLERDLEAVPPRHAVPRGTKLDRYHGIIRERLDTYPELSAVRLFAEVQAAGYAGGITQVRDYVARVRPRPDPEPVVRFETAPGHQAQVDFAEFRFPWGKRHALLVVLGYSRLLWLKFYPQQTMAVVMAALEEAFAYFGGVPRELLFDQMKAVIVEDQRLDDGKLLENAEFLRFAHHWHFRIRACRPYRAQTKGKVERPVRYVRGNFIYGREFVGDADLDAQRRWWLDAVANPRVHQTLHAVPRERFEADERAVLQPLAERPYRPLVLPEARRVRRTVVRPLTAEVAVERRGLQQYQALLAADAVEAGV